MSSLQKIKLGTPPNGKDGDTARAAFERINANVDVLNMQGALTSAPLVSASLTLTDDHIGKRVSVSFPAAGGIVKMKCASTCVPDSIVWLINVGAKTLALGVDDNSGDSIALGALNPGEGAILDTDGVHAWRVLLRGRTWGGDETVSGKLTVATDINVGGGGTFGKLSVAADMNVGGTGSFASRPTFAGKTPWDTGNFNPVNYLTSAGTPTLTGSLRATGYLFAGSGANPRAGQGSYFSWNDASGDGVTYLCCNRGGGGGGFVLRTVNEDNTIEHGRFSISPSGVGTNGSDARLKYGVKTISNALERIRKIRGVIYRYKATGEYHYGVVAQEVKPHFPCAVSVTHSTKDHEDLLGVSYNDLIGPIIEAIKEVARDVDALKAVLVRQAI